MKVGSCIVATVLSAGLAVHAQEPIVRPGVAFSGASIKLSKVSHGRPAVVRPFTSLAADAEFFGGLGRPVVDNTGLSGNFEMHLEFRREYRGERPASLTQLALPSVRDALQEHLGLKLVPKTGAWTVFVIDSIERPVTY